jgi:hypothetical protein
MLVVAASCGQVRSAGHSGQWNVGLLCNTHVHVRNANENYNPNGAYEDEAHDVHNNKRNNNNNNNNDNNK